MFRKLNTDETNARAAEEEAQAAQRDRSAEMNALVRRHLDKLTSREQDFMSSVQRKLSLGLPLSDPMSKWLTDLADKARRYEPKTPEDADSYVTITSGMRGYFAVLVQKNEDGWHEPYNTGIGSYATAEEAVPEGQEWAQAEGIPFFAPDEPKEAAQPVAAAEAVKAARPRM